MEGVLNVSFRGYPATTAFFSLKPGIGGIDCVIAVEGVSQVVLTRLNLAQGELSVSWIIPGNCAGNWKDQPGRPLKIWGEERPRPTRVDTPAPKLSPNIASINEITHQPQLSLNLDPVCPFKCEGEVGNPVLSKEGDAVYPSILIPILRIDRCLMSILQSRSGPREAREYGQLGCLVAPGCRC